MNILDYSLLLYMSYEEAVKVSAYRHRSKLLASSDWTQMPDSPLSAELKQAWVIYRQELRDITSQSGFPSDIEWPTVPSN